MKSIKKRMIFILIPLFTFIFSCAQNDLSDKIGSIEDDSTAYFVRYDDNGADANLNALPVDTKYYKNSKVTLPFPKDGAGNELTKFGYIFTGWSTVDTAVSPEYSSDDIYIMQESDVTFFAQWLPLTDYFNRIADDAEIGTTTVKITYPSNIKFVYAKNSDESFMVFPTQGTNPREIFLKFFISDTVVTNDLFAEVLQWALNHSKFNGGSDANEITATEAKYGTQVLIEFGLSDISYSNGGGGKNFSVNGKGQHPVTGVTLYGAIMFCNWLTEILDNSANIVYTGMSATVWTSTTATDSKTGYRLPTNMEWEYAARYLGQYDYVSPPSEFEYYPDQGITLGWNNSIVGHTMEESECQHALLPSWIPKTPPLTPGYYWAPYNYLSGAKTYYDNTTESVGLEDAGDYWNKRVAVFGQSFTAEVKSKKCNAFGLYDMSGNVWEWCLSEREWVISDSFCELRGGSYMSTPDKMVVSEKDDTVTMATRNKQTGFRLAKTKS